MGTLVTRLEAVKKIVRKAGGKRLINQDEMLDALDGLNEAIQGAKERSARRSGPRLSFWYWYAVRVWVELAHENKRPVWEQLSKEHRNALTRQILNAMNSNEGRAYIDYCVEYEVKADGVKPRSKRVPDLHDLREFILHDVHGADAADLTDQFGIPADAFTKEDYAPSK